MRALRSIFALSFVAATVHADAPPTRVDEILFGSPDCQETLGAGLDPNQPYSRASDLIRARFDRTVSSENGVRFDNLKQSAQALRSAINTIRRAKGLTSGEQASARVSPYELSDLKTSLGGVQLVANVGHVAVLRSQLSAPPRITGGVTHIFDRILGAHDGRRGLSYPYLDPGALNDGRVVNLGLGSDPSKFGDRLQELVDRRWAQIENTTRLTQQHLEETRVATDLSEEQRREEVRSIEASLRRLAVEREELYAAWEQVRPRAALANTNLGVRILAEPSSELTRNASVPPFSDPRGSFAACADSLVNAIRALTDEYQAEIAGLDLAALIAAVDQKLAAAQAGAQTIATRVEASGSSCESGTSVDRAIPQTLDQQNIEILDRAARALEQFEAPVLATVRSSSPDWENRPDAATFKADMQLLDRLAARRILEPDNPELIGEMDAILTKYERRRAPGCNPRSADCTPQKSADITLQQNLSWLYQGVSSPTSQHSEGLSAREVAVFDFSLRNRVIESLSGGACARELSSDIEGRSTNRAQQDLALLERLSILSPALREGVRAVDCGSGAFGVGERLASYGKQSKDFIHDDHLPGEVAFSFQLLGLSDDANGNPVTGRVDADRILRHLYDRVSIRLGNVMKESSDIRRGVRNFAPGVLGDMDTSTDKVWERISKGDLRLEDMRHPGILAFALSDLKCRAQGEILSGAREKPDNAKRLSVAQVISESMARMPDESAAIQSSGVYTPWFSSNPPGPRADRLISRLRELGIDRDNPNCWQEIQYAVNAAIAEVHKMSPEYRYLASRLNFKEQLRTATQGALYEYFAALERTSPKPNAEAARVLWDAFKNKCENEAKAAYSAFEQSIPSTAFPSGALRGAFEFGRSTFESMKATATSAMVAGICDQVFKNERPNFTAGTPFSVTPGLAEYRRKAQALTDQTSLVARLLREQGKERDAESIERYVRTGDPRLLNELMLSPGMLTSLLSKVDMQKALAQHANDPIFRPLMTAAFDRVENMRTRSYFERHRQDYPADVYEQRLKQIDRRDQHDSRLTSLMDQQVEEIDRRLAAVNQGGSCQINNPGRLRSYFRSVAVLGNGPVTGGVGDRMAQIQGALKEGGTGTDAFVQATDAAVMAIRQFRDAVATHDAYDEFDSRVPARLELLVADMSRELDGASALDCKGWLTKLVGQLRTLRDDQHRFMAEHRGSTIDRVDLITTRQEIAARVEATMPEATRLAKEACTGWWNAAKETGRAMPNSITQYAVHAAYVLTRISAAGVTFGASEFALRATGVNTSLDNLEGRLANGAGDAVDGAWDEVREWSSNEANRQASVKELACAQAVHNLNKTIVRLAIEGKARGMMDRELQPILAFAGNLNGALAQNAGGDLIARLDTAAAVVSAVRNTAVAVGVAAVTGQVAGILTSSFEGAAAIVAANEAAGLAATTGSAAARALTLFRTLRIASFAANALNHAVRANALWGAGGGLALGVLRGDPVHQVLIQTAEGASHGVTSTYTDPVMLLGALVPGGAAGLGAIPGRYVGRLASTYFASHMSYGLAKTYLEQIAPNLQRKADLERLLAAARKSGQTRIADGIQATLETVNRTLIEEGVGAATTALMLGHMGWGAFRHSRMGDTGLTFDVIGEQIVNGRSYRTVLVHDAVNPKTGKVGPAVRLIESGLFEPNRVSDLAAAINSGADYADPNLRGLIDGMAFQVKWPGGGEGAQVPAMIALLNNPKVKAAIEGIISNEGIGLPPGVAVEDVEHALAVYEFLLKQKGIEVDPLTFEPTQATREKYGLEVDPRTGRITQAARIRLREITGDLPLAMAKGRAIVAQARHGVEHGPVAPELAQAEAALRNEFRSALARAAGSLGRLRQEAQVRVIDSVLGSVCEGRRIQVMRTIAQESLRANPSAETVELPGSGGLRVPKEMAMTPEELKDLDGQIWDLIAQELMPEVNNFGNIRALTEEGIRAEFRLQMETNPKIKSVIQRVMGWVEEAFRACKDAA